MPMCPHCSVWLSSSIYLIFPFLLFGCRNCIQFSAKTNHYLVRMQPLVVTHFSAGLIHSRFHGYCSNTVYLNCDKCFLGAPDKVTSCLMPQHAQLFCKFDSRHFFRQFFFCLFNSISKPKLTEKTKYTRTIFAQKIYYCAKNNMQSIVLHFAYNNIWWNQYGN